VNDQCQYMVFPTDGRLPFVVESHPYPSMISDDLGGAVVQAAVVMPEARAAMWVREDAATTGYQKNPLASIVATLMNNDYRPTIVVGPAVLTSLVPVGLDPATGAVLSEGEGIGADNAHGIAEVAVDIAAALAGSDGPFQTDDIRPGWAERIRFLWGRLDALPVPGDWPDSENRPLPYDRLSAGLERRYPGSRFVPFRVEGPTI